MKRFDDDVASLMPVNFLVGIRSLQATWVHDSNRESARCFVAWTCWICCALLDTIFT
jgi:hypothetical protein